MSTGLDMRRVMVRPNHSMSTCHSPSTVMGNTRSSQVFSPYGSLIFKSASTIDARLGMEEPGWRAT